MISKSRAFLPTLLIAFWLMIASAWQVLAVDPIVSNVQAKQRGGSRLVDITYDVADPDSPTLTVYLKVSSDGGKTWKGPVVMVKGDVGLHIVPGTAKKLIWDAGKEMPNQFGVKYRYRIGASDQWIPPAGMALIPGGGFQLGDERVEYAFPVQNITVSAFAIDKLEVSSDLWREVTSWGNARGYDLNADQSNGGKYPVLVSWHDAAKWNNARSEREGRTPSYYENDAMTRIYRNGIKNDLSVNWKNGYRLPTDAEWEKAAKGGIEGKLYPWGTDDINPDLANYYKSNIGGPVPVGTYSPNPYGLYDMAGNVFEWCWDWYGSTAKSGEVDPRGPMYGSRRVLRGGGWSFDSVLGRLARREAYEPSAGFGFRSALPAGQP